MLTIFKNLFQTISCCLCLALPLAPGKVNKVQLSLEKSKEGCHLIAVVDDYDDDILNILNHMNDNGRFHVLKA